MRGNPVAIGRGTRRMLGKRGYVLTLAKGHPRANRDGYVPEHILVAERALGKHVPLGCPVHHVDGDPANNTPSNLVVCQDQGYHKLLHQRATALKACGDASALKCDICHRHDRQNEIRVYSYRKGVGRYGRHLSCNRAHVAKHARSRSR